MSVDIGSLKDPSRNLLPVWLAGPGGLYQLVHVCEVAILISNISTVNGTQLWIVAPHPPLAMHLLEHKLEQPTKGQ